jgi:phage head maturation protease
MADEPLFPTNEDISTEIPDAEIEVRDIAKREIGMLIARWDTPVDTNLGLESVRRGAFSEVDPADVVLKVGHKGPVVGRGFALQERDEGVHMDFRVSKTLNGDEALTLASDGVMRRASVEYSPRGTQGEVSHKGGKRTVRLSKVALKAVAMTYQPSYEGTAVTYVREEEGATDMPDSPVEVPETPAPVIDVTNLNEAIANIGPIMARSLDPLAARLEKLEERSRQDIIIPSRNEPDVRGQRGEWVATVLRMLSGERVPDLQMRELADLVTTDNIGVVPDAFLSELIGVIDPSRPFMGSTRRLDLPPAGMSLVVPVIETRPTVGRQVNGSGTLEEKADIESTPTSITTETFDAITLAGGGDISLQLLKRSSPSFLSLYLELLAEAYAANAESEALDALLASLGGSGGVNEAGALDPEALTLGAAWANGAAVRKPPNTMWLSTAAVGEFIDAKADGSNMPLYSSIQAGFSASSGAGGTIQGLRPIHVPALDDKEVDVIVGPSSGFGWTEDGTYTLQVDVPAKAGRDVAIVGILWFAPMYPSAFTAYTIGS